MVTDLGSLFVANWRAGLGKFKNLQDRIAQLGYLVIFCSTSLPLTSTKWVQSTIKLCTVLSLSSALSINLGNIEIENIRERRESNPVLLGKK